MCTYHPVMNSSASRIEYKESKLYMGTCLNGTKSQSLKKNSGLYQYMNLEYLLMRAINNHELCMKKKSMLVYYLSKFLVLVYFSSIK